MTEPIWLSEPAAHDYPAALEYLTLVMEPAAAKRSVKALKQAATEKRKAKDVLRASGLSPLGQDNAHVRNDLAKIQAGVALSPILLVRGIPTAALPLVIADGFHRVCAAHVVDEDAEIPCRIVSLE